MRARACVPVWTYDAAFYTALLEGTKMAIRTDPVKGKGLFAKESIEKGEIIHQETALVCSQNMDSIRSSIPACQHCLRSLETPRRVVARVCRSKRTALELPFGKLLAPETPVQCVFARNGCTAKFCSARCRETAWNSYHAVLCEGHMEAQAQRDALEAFYALNWVQNGVDYSDTAMVALRAVAQFLVRHRVHGMSLEEGFLPFAQLIKAPLDRFYFAYLLKGEEGEDGGDAADAESPDRGAIEGHGDAVPTEESVAKRQQLYENVQEVARDPLSSPSVRAHYGPGERDKAAFVATTLGVVRDMMALTPEEEGFLNTERWSGLLGAVLLNGQERSPPSYYALLKDAVEANITDVGSAMSMEGFEKMIKAKHPNAKVEDLYFSTYGQGIYAVGCLFNHSCEPNLQVIYSDTNDETLVVMAIRDIATDEELCISYIEEDLDFAKRQEQLSQHYHFDCRCPKCLKDSKGLL